MQILSYLLKQLPTIIILLGLTYIQKPRLLYIKSVLLPLIRKF